MVTRFLETIGVWTPEPAVRRHEDSFGTRVPSRHDAFSFQVTVREVWSRRGRADDLALEVAAWKEDHRATVRRRLRAISRRYPPNCSAAFEQQANNDLGQPERTASEPGLTYACSFEAAPDEAIVSRLQGLEHERLAAEASHLATMRNLEHLEAIEKRWLDFLQRLGRDPLGPAIARLAGGPELADAIARYAAQQEQKMADLREVCDTATEAFREKGAYELVTTTDSAFSRLLHHITQGAEPSPNGSEQNGRRPRRAP